MIGQRLRKRDTGDDWNGTRRLLSNFGLRHPELVPLAMQQDIDHNERNESCQNQQSYHFNTSIPATLEVHFEARASDGPL
jgi:hypothetical protein